MEPIHFQLMCMNKALEVRNCARKVLRSFDTGIVKKLRKFQYWAKKHFFIKKHIVLDVAGHSEGSFQF